MESEAPLPPVSKKSKGLKPTARLKGMEVPARGLTAAIILSITPTLALALYAQRYLVEGLSLGAVKG